MKLVLEGQSINDTLQTFVTCDTTPSDSKNAKVPNLSHLPSVEDFLDALASLDFTLVSESVSEWAEFRIWNIGAFYHVILSTCHLVNMSSC